MSRESIIWNEHTREYVEKVIEDAKEEASNLVQEKLDEDDFFKWMQRCNEIISKAGNNWGRSKTALSVLAKLVDTSDLAPQFNKTDIRFNKDPRAFFKGFTFKVIRKRHSNSDIERSPLDYWRAFDPNRLYLLEGDGRHSQIKDSYLYSYHQGVFITIKKHTDEEIKEKYEDIKEQEDLGLKETKKKIKEVINRRDELFKLLKSSDEYDLKDYSEVEVPEDFEKKAKEKKQKAELTPKERRKLQNRVVAFTYREVDKGWSSSSFNLTKVEPKIKDLNEVKNKVYYLTSKDDNLMQMCSIFDCKPASRSAQNNYDPHFFSKNLAMDEDYNLPLFLRFSKRNVKHVKDNPKFLKIRKLLYNNDEKNNMKALGDYFVPYFTGKYIHDTVKHLNYLHNFKPFNPEIHQIYKYLSKYIHDNYEHRVTHKLKNHPAFIEFRRYADKLIEFQLFNRNKDKSDKEIEKKALELFGEKDVEKAYALNLNIVRLAEELEEYSSNIKTLFNEINFLTSSVKDIPDSAERLINEMLISEGLDEFELSEASINYLNNIQLNND